MNLEIIKYNYIRNTENPGYNCRFFMGWYTGFTHYQWGHCYRKKYNQGNHTFQRITYG